MHERKKDGERERKRTSCTALGYARCKISSDDRLVHGLNTTSPKPCLSHFDIPVSMLFYASRGCYPLH